jgi:hypothetical protein
MDASKITELLQKQNTRYICRSQTVDSSTMTWRNQIQYSKYIKGVATCTGLQNTNVPTQAACSLNGINTYGGQGKDTALATGSTQRYPSVYAGAAGSAAQVYSSDIIMLQKAGRELCAGLITPQDAYTILPVCSECINTNGPTKESPTVPINNNQTNAYLPAFDTYYRFKNPQCNQPIPDQNQKHFVSVGHSPFLEKNGAGCTVATCDGCVATPSS